MKPREVFSPGEYASTEHEKNDDSLFISYPESSELAWLEKLMRDCDITFDNQHLRQTISHSYIHQRLILDLLYQVFLYNAYLASLGKSAEFIVHFK
jgi:hypothetical protein